MKLKTLKDKTKLQKCWIWNKTVSDFIKERVKGYSLNICAGMNEIGDIRLDLDPKDKSILKGDMRNLPYPDNTFDTVISDPPWKIGFYERPKPFFEAFRVCKVGGTIIYNATWIPTTKYKDILKLKELWVRTDNDWTNTSIISVFEKINNITEEDLK